jgi:hypothetical protein
VATNSDALQARLADSTKFSASSVLATTLFSKPVLLDDLFNDNRAGSFSGGWVTGIGGTLPDGSANDVNNWDMGDADDPTALLTPRSSVLQTTLGTDGDASNVVTDTPGFKSPYDVTVNVLASRMYPAFRQAAIVAQILPPNLMGDYHLATASPASPARGAGVASTIVRWGVPGNSWNYTVSAATPDIDGDARPTGTRYDAGSDQMKP